MQDGRIQEGFTSVVNDMIHRDEKDPLNYDYKKVANALISEIEELLIPGVTLHPEIKTIIKKISAHACQDKRVCQEFGLDPNKSLLLIGGVGLFKTFIISWLRSKPFFNPYFSPCDDVVRNVAENGAAGYKLYFREKDYVFDDLGTEKSCNHFGTKYDVVEDIIQKRYELFINIGIKTFWTSNLMVSKIDEENEILQRYGLRSFDRLKAMSNLIVFPDTESYRGKTRTKAEIEQEKAEEKGQLLDYPTVITEHYEECLEAGQYQNYGMDHIYYEFLNMNEIIGLSIEQKKDMLEKARGSILRLEKAKGNLRPKKEVIEALAIAHCKKEAYKKFISDHMELGTTVGELLELLQDKS